MAVNVNVSISKSFEVACSAKKAFDQLVDVASTTKLFPKLDKIVQLGNDVWRWEMAKIGAAGKKALVDSLGKAMSYEKKTP